MSAILINFDTKTKALDVKMDGKTIKNVSQVGIYAYDDEAHIELTTAVSDGDNGTYERHTIYADKVLVDKILGFNEYKELSDKLCKQLGVE